MPTPPAKKKWAMGSFSCIFLALDRVQFQPKTRLYKIFSTGHTPLEYFFLKFVKQYINFKIP